MMRTWLTGLAWVALASCYSATPSGDAGSVPAGRDAAVTAEENFGRDAGVVHTDPAYDAGATRTPAPTGKGPKERADAATVAAISDELDAGAALSLDCPPPDGVADDPSDVQEPLALELASAPPIGAPFALAVSTRTGAPLTTTVRVCANGAALATLQLYRGRGSVTLRVAEPGPLLLQVRAAHAYGSRTVVARARVTRRYEGSLDPGTQQHEWTAAEDVVIEGILRLGAAESLTIGPGTRVLLGANAILTVAGQLRVQGTAEDPVLFTRVGEPAWGSVRLGPDARAWLDHTWFVAGGGDSSRAFGHSRSQPVVFVDSGSLAMRGGGLIDNPGKAFGSKTAHVSLDGTLISRCDTGGQFDTSQLEFRHLHVLEIPDADGRLDDDDNDGFYIDDLSDDAGVEAVIEDSVFAHGEDDAIDQNGAAIRLERVWIEGFAHEGVACSNKRSVSIRDSVVRDCGQGIEAGYGAPHVRVERSLITGNGVGLRYGDEYTTPTSGTLDVSQSIVVGNAENVRNFVSKLGGPLPAALQVTCSVLDDVLFAGSAGNVRPPTSQPWPTPGSCSESTLLDPQLCAGSVAGPPCLPH